MNEGRNGGKSGGRNEGKNEGRNEGRKDVRVCDVSVCACACAARARAHACSTQQATSTYANEITCSITLDDWIPVVASDDTRPFAR